MRGSCPRPREVGTRPSDDPNCKRVLGPEKGGNDPGEPGRGDIGKKQDLCIWEIYADRVLIRLVIVN